MRKSLVLPLAFLAGALSFQYPSPLCAGDGDPFPLNLEITSQGGKSLGKWVRGKGEYRAFQVGPFVELIATGQANFNTTVALHASQIAVFPPQFGLHFLVPDIQLPALRPFVVEAGFYSKEPVSSVVVWDVDGKHDIPIDQTPD